MDTEALFTATKWDILKILEERPHAPIELAKRLGSSLANISQQLRLLELAGVITSDRVSNRDKGQPRVRYRLAGDLSYLISASGSFVDKKVVHLSERNKVVLRIWFLEEREIRYALEKAFWELEQQLAGISKITYAGMEGGSPVLEIKATHKLPARIETGKGHAPVLVRSTKEPVGYVLYGEG